MSIKLNPYLSFKGNAREAMEFYQSVFGGKLDARTFKEFNAAPDPSEEDQIMHASLEAESIEFFASDAPMRMNMTAGDNFSMSLSGSKDDEAELTGYFNKLAEGGQVTMPLEKAVWGDTFGMLEDRFGIHWMVNISGQD